MTSQAYAIPDELKAEVYSKTDRKKEKISEIEHEKSGESGEKSYFAILLEAIREISNHMIWKWKFELILDNTFEIFFCNPYNKKNKK